MTRGIKVDDCPIKQEICFPNCFFWRNEKCDHAKIIVETREKKRESSVEKQRKIANNKD